MFEKLGITDFCSKADTATGYRAVAKTDFTGMAAFSHANSANEKSPLFESTNSVQYAVGVVWTAYKSKKMIDVYESN